MTITKRAVAPEVKSADDDVSGAFTEFMTTFEAFREANDQRLAEMETKLSSDVVSREKVDRISDAMDRQQRAVEQMLLKKSRPALGRGSLLQVSEHKAAFDSYLRRGDETSMRRLETKDFTYGGDGGYLVPDELDTEIGQRLAALSPIRAISTVRQVSGAVLKKPFAKTGMASGWVGETDARPKTDTSTLAELSFPTMELYAMPAATASLLDDAVVDMDAWIASEIEVAFAEQESDAFVNGASSDKPKGFLSYTMVADASWAWDKIGYIATGVDGAWAASDPSDTLIDTIYALKAGYRQNAHFVMNRKTQAAIRKFKDDDGNYIWQPPASVGQPAALMGFPLVESEDMPDIGSDTFPIAFGDFRRGYMVVDRTGVRVLRDPYSAKPYVLFYTTKRVGGGVQNFEAIKLIKFGET